MYTCGTLKPLRRPTTLVFCDKKQLMTMDRTAPGYEVTGSVPYFMDSAREPVLQLVRHPNNSTFKMWKDNKCGVPGIPENGLATRNCACLESSLGNNMEAGYFFTICIPRSFCCHLGAWSHTPIAWRPSTTPPSATSTLR